VAFILTDQLHEEATGDTAFERYQAYLRDAHDQFPVGAYALATSEWYFNSSDHRAPHDAWLESVRICEHASAGEGAHRSASILIRLLGAYHDGHIELRYRDVRSYRIELQPQDVAEGGHGDWRYDEFRLAPGGAVVHEIEWWDRRPTGTWLIEAADVEYRWVPIGAPDSGTPA
jgi:hypothetical protein